ncbi:MAG: multiheme c-type cytochrome [Acidobacteriota bacterium]
MTRLSLAMRAFFCLVGLSASPTWATPEEDEYLGGERCLTCHADIGVVQTQSDHALSVRRPEEVTDFVQALPLHFVDPANGVQYSFEKPIGDRFYMVARNRGLGERIQLLWAFGAGRKGITFVGRSGEGRYGQVRVSWYAATNTLDLTPGLKPGKANVSDALAQWFAAGERQECFRCHVSRQSEELPEQIKREHAGVHCERCHGPGGNHFRAVTQGSKDLAIRHPGRLSDREQYRFCGECHRQAPADFDTEAINQILEDPVSIRFPARRLILSRCYQEGDGQLRCTACHDPHGQLASGEEFDAKCSGCHAESRTERSHCPKSKTACISCHMPRVQLAPHLSFADHWIRVVR